MSLAAPAGSADDTQARLEQLRLRLDALQKELNTTRGQRDAVRDEVFGLERRIGELLRSLRQADARLKAQQRQLERLRQRAEHERQAVSSHESLAAQTLRAAHAMGHQDTLRLLLNQDDPARLGRLMTYHRYVQEARAREIATLGQSIERLDRLERELAARGRELAATRQTQGEQKTQVEEARRARAQMLAGLNREVRSREREVERLRGDRERLERLLREIRPLLPAVPLPERGTRFARLAGRLGLPTRGGVVARFNEPKGLGDLRWRGILVAAREGEAVRAVAGGQVVYADALRGFGLLLILDHGDGYMTLYGHNQSLHRQAGDWVEAGEVVGLVGNTGDAPRPGVYFEIRHHGEPQDPLRWCSARAS